MLAQILAISRHDLRVLARFTGYLMLIVAIAYVASIIKRPRQGPSLAQAPAASPGAIPDLKITEQNLIIDWPADVTITQSLPAPEDDPAISTSVARIQAKGPVFKNARAALEDVAAMVSMPIPTTPDAAKAVVSRAGTNAARMAKYRGKFPLPADTPDRLLAALTDQDVLELANTLQHFGAEQNKRSLKADLSNDLTVQGNVATWFVTSSDVRCLEYDLTFTRRTYRQGIAAWACISTDTQWSMQATPPFPHN